MPIPRSLVRQLSNNQGLRRLLSTTPMAANTANMDKFKLADKYKGLERNVWVEFIALALEHKPLNLGQGFPDDLVPEYVTKTLTEVVEEDPVLINQYTRGHGHPRLINALSKLYTDLLKRPTPIAPTTETLVTVGAYEALFTAIMGFVNPGDEVMKDIIIDNRRVN